VLAGYFDNGGRILAAIAIKETDSVSAVKPANGGKMTGLGALENNFARAQLAVDIKTIGHAC
jgi:hypothetical protein